MNSRSNPQERQFNPEWEELVAGEVLGELTESERDRLGDFRNTREYSELSLSLQATLGGVQLALEPSMEVMPDALKDRIVRDAPGYLKQTDEMSDLPEVRLNLDRATEVDLNAGEGLRRSSGTRSGLPAIREALAWLACAAAIVVAVGLWKPESKPVELTLSQQREVLQRSAQTIQVPWAAATSPFETPVSGDVVWNTEQQQGVMRFVGLPKNDPTVEQYQLWIIDPGRDEEPIDGGVFDAGDVDENGEVFVEINAKLNVVSPGAFAITIEKPGGVVVSTQDRLPLIAMVN
ncbi:MAG: anti-sigma factor [Pirellulaceae bacterium]